MLYFHEIFRASLAETRGGARNSPTQRLTFQTGGLNQKGHHHVPFKISSFEGRKHVIFHKNNLKIIISFSD